VLRKVNESMRVCLRNGKFRGRRQIGNTGGYFESVIHTAIYVTTPGGGLCQVVRL
jgi:hypothetical protein